jgi:hypothetical protein
MVVEGEPRRELHARNDLTPTKRMERLSTSIGTGSEVRAHGQERQRMELAER